MTRENPTAVVPAYVPEDELEYRTTDQVSGQEVLEGLALALWQVAEDAGWHKTETFGDKNALITSEISEALEEFRNGHDVTEIYYSYETEVTTTSGDRHKVTIHTDQRTKEDGTLNKVEGVAAEYADAIIRILDEAVQRRIPVVEALFQKHAFNKTRPHRHGGKIL